MGKKIEIPFNAWSKERLAWGIKWSTTRTKKYGSAIDKDWFVVGRKKYELTAVYEKRYKEIVRELYNIEGAVCENELRKVFKHIFRGKEPRADRYLWVHLFKPKLKEVSEQTIASSNRCPSLEARGRSSDQGIKIKCP